MIYSRFLTPIRCTFLADKLYKAPCRIGIFQRWNLSGRLSLRSFSSQFADFSLKPIGSGTVYSNVNSASFAYPSCKMFEAKHDLDSIN